LIAASRNRVEVVIANRVAGRKHGSDKRSQAQRSQAHRAVEAKHPEDMPADQKRERVASEIASEGDSIDHMVYKDARDSGQPTSNPSRRLLPWNSLDDLL
jgi:hypothetical protein